MSPLDFLRQLGGGDGPHDIARAALMLAALDHPGRPLEPYLGQLDALAQAMRTEAGNIRNVGDGARLLAERMAGDFGYAGDRATYDDPKNADLMSVIERRRGLPVSLGILYIHAARAAGLTACGLDAPGHFLVRIGYRHNDMTVDPFNAGAGLAEGSPASLAQPASDTDVLLRLQNNLKLRALEAGDRERGLEVAQRMTVLAPKRPDLWFDLARLNEAVGVLGAARKAYETCLNFAPAGEPLHNEAALSLAHLKRRLN
jgi:regulator of sirC expression with transglutaminase-like and TPR domain